MKKGVLKDADKYAKAHKRRNRWYNTVVFLAAAAVFCTTYALILPAITLEKDSEDPILSQSGWLSEFTELSEETENLNDNEADSDELPKDEHDAVTSDEGSSYSTTGPPESEDAETADVETSSDESSVDETSKEETSSEETSTDETSIEDTSNEESSTEESSNEQISGEDGLTEETSTETSGTADTDDGVSSDTTYTDSSQDTTGKSDTVSDKDDTELSPDTNEGDTAYSDTNVETENPNSESLGDSGESSQNDVTDGESVADSKDSGEISDIVSGTEKSDETSKPTVHTHSEKCYKDGELICGLEESKPITVKPEIKLLEILPTDSDISKKITEYYADGDNEGLCGYLEELADMIEYIRSECLKLSEDSKEPVSLDEQLEKVEELIKSLTDGRVPRLDGDLAYVSDFSIYDEYVEDNESDDIENTIKNGQTAVYKFALSTDSYTGDIFEYGRIKFEIVLPFTSEEVEFVDTSIFDNVEITEDEVQTLVGYISTKIPNSIDGSVSVRVNKLDPDTKLFLEMSAAVEYGTWDGECETHGCVEKYTVTSNELTVLKTYTAEEREVFFERFKSLINDEDDLLMLADDYKEEFALAYGEGKLTKEQYTKLLYLIEDLLLDTDSIAEAAHGDNWKTLRDSGWFEEYSDYAYYSEDIWDFGTYSAEAFDVAPIAALEGDTSPSSVQIDDPGGTNSADDVTVSKTIAGTELENVFDITLTVQTPQKIDEVISEPDMAVVIVMDISNTMNDNFGGVTRYAAAMEAAEDFLDNFAANNTLGVSKVGYVAFNTDAHQIFGLQSCTNATQANALKNTMRTETGSIINADNYGSAHNRFTNIEGGLKLAQDMLDGVSNKNKFIILLTDGFPTTYLESGYKGYDPYDTTGRFYDHILNVPCSSGTSYSDEAAIRARNMAASIRKSGTTIFSIGVDVGGQTIQAYIDSSEKLAKGESKISIVDRTGTTYEIGSATSTEAYKNWLQNSIGSGYYYDSTNTEGLKDAYNRIFAEIKTTVETAAKADWVASDPIPSITPDEIDFIGLFDKDGTLQGNSLAGSHAEGAEDTASYANSTITWDLKKSGYTVQTGDTTIYTYELKYRVRLRNEDSQFKENTIYRTNGDTTLQYRVIQTVNGTTTISDSKTIEFPIPSVHGYLGELEFTKVDTMGNPLAGAEFTLAHDTKQCTECRGDGTAVKIDSVTATSGEDGKVLFINIPSGHTYTLEETKVPDSYLKYNDDTYSVVVAYDKVTVTVFTKDGAEKAVWNMDEDNTIKNRIAYELPNTGGSGTTIYIISGITLVCASLLLMYTNSRRRKKVE